MIRPGRRYGRRYTASESIGKPAPLALWEKISIVVMIAVVVTAVVLFTVVIAIGVLS